MWFALLFAVSAADRSAAALAEGCMGADVTPCPAAVAWAGALLAEGRTASALAVVRSVTDRGPDALTVFVAASEALGDSSDLEDLPSDAVPDALRGPLAYARLRGLLRAGRTTEAYAIGWEGMGPPYLARTQFVRALLNARGGKLKSAVRGFTDVVRGAPSEPMPKAGSPEDELRMAALSNIARIYYGIQQYDVALKYWEMIPESSRAWEGAALGLAWVAFMRGRATPPSIAVLERRGSAEAFLLHGLFLFNTCMYAEVPALLARVEDWRPVVDRLEGALARGDAGFAATFDLMDVPRPLRARFEADARTQGLRAHLAQIAKERGKGGVFLDAERDRVTLLLDAQLAKRARYEVAYHRDLLQQAEVLGFETAEARALIGNGGGCNSGGAPDPAAQAEARGRLEALITHSSGDLLRRARLRAADELEDPAARLAVYDALGSFTDDGYEGMYLDRRAAALDALGRHEEAAAERLRLLETAPSGELGAEAWLLVGEARFEAGDFVGARSAYETVMSIARPGAPRWAFANYKLAWCQWALGDRQAAVERLRAALTDLDPPIAAIAAQELKKLEAALLR